MTWLILALAFVALAVLFAIALGFAGRSQDTAHEAALTELAGRTSPSGQPFFQDGDAVLDFEEAVEEAKRAAEESDREPS